MFSDEPFVGEYQMESVVECSVYSVLSEGKKGATGQPILLRHWLAARAPSEEKQARIQAEVAALQAVQHPHLLPILEVCLSEQGTYLASAHASGGTLATRLARSFLKPLPLEESLRIITQIGQALDALHQSNLLHGNLTPHAVFFSESNQVRVGEFRLKEVLECIPNYQPDLGEGIPLCWYMAPEQFSGVFDASTDQYALGCLAYHLLTGRVPFAGSDRAALLQKHVQEQPRTLIELNPAVPALVEAAVLKALAKQPAERHGSVRAFLEALQPSSREEIASQETAENPMLDQGLAATSQWTWEREPFQQPGPSGPVVGIDKRPVIPTRFDSALVGKRQHLALPRHRRELVALSSTILLVLFLTVVAGRWLFFSVPSSSGKSSSHASQGSSALTPTGSQATASLQTTPISGISPTPQASTQPSTLTVTPLLDCVSQTGNTFLAEFGYQNPNAFAVTIPLGGKNAISPSNSDGSQPTSFASGSYHQVFQVHFFRHGTVSWSLNGLTVTASNNSPRC